MEHILKLLPAMGFNFFVIIVSTSIYNLICGYESISNWWILQVAVFVFAIWELNVLLEKINFKTYRSFFLTQLSIVYVLLLVVGYLWKWFSFTPGAIFQITVMCILITAVIHFYFYQMSKSNADEINDMLQKDRS